LLIEAGQLEAEAQALEVDQLRAEQFEVPSGFLVTAIVHQPQPRDLLGREIMRNMNRARGHSRLSPGRAAQMADDDYTLGIAKRAAASSHIRGSKPPPCQPPAHSTSGHSWDSPVPDLSATIRLRNYVPTEGSLNHLGWLLRFPFAWLRKNF
jgi:hypothetical protein